MSTVGGLNMNLKDRETMSDMLTKAKLENKTVDVLLRNGTSIKGDILDIGAYCLVMELKGAKSFFDTVIRIEDISSFDIQVRE